MQYIQERGKGVAGNLANLSLLHQRLVEQIGRIRLFLVSLFGPRSFVVVLVLLLL
jgi:hypothetical protein